MIKVALLECKSGSIAEKTAHIVKKGAYHKMGTLLYKLTHFTTIYQHDWVIG